MNRDYEKILAVIKEKNVAYPAEPFDPPERFPEFSKSGLIKNVNPQNKIYEMVRRLLYLLDLDKEHYQTPEWKPFKSLVKSGDKIVIKPNLVFHDHPLGEAGFLSMVTHASIIRPIVDYLLLSTDNEVEVIIADAPLQSGDFKATVYKNGLQALLDYYATLNINIPLIDLRLEVALLDKEGIIIRRERKNGDPAGYTVVDLKQRSAFNEITKYSNRLEVTDYPSGSVSKHHNAEKNEYLISKSVLEANFFINVPKLKTHKKAGISVAMKSLVGIVGDKSWIAHHRRGGPNSGGDEYDKRHPISYLGWHLDAWLKRHKFTRLLDSNLRKLYSRVFLGGKTLKQLHLEQEEPIVIEGNWYGNDTVWRTVLDLNNILFFADKSGQLHSTPQRKYLAIVDGIMAGEKNGPMEHLPCAAGLLFGGSNPVAVDFLAATLMGFDYRSIPVIVQGLKNDFFNLCPYSIQEWIIHIQQDLRECIQQFKPPTNWRGHIELIEPDTVLEKLKVVLFPD